MYATRFNNTLFKNILFYNVLLIPQQNCFRAKSRHQTTNIFQEGVQTSNNQPESSNITNIRKYAKRKQSGIVESKLEVRRNSEFI